MRVFIAAVVCAAAIGVGASYVLHMQQETVDVAFSSSGAHVGDPGTIWSGWIKVEHGRQLVRIRAEHDLTGAKPVTPQ